MKVCTKCKVEKPVTEFHKHATNRDGRCGSCKACNLTSNAVSSAKWRAAHPEENRRRARDSQLKVKFGVTLEWYDRLLVTQGGRCAICGTDVPGGRGGFHVDHCHETGVIRRLLCHMCNVGLGHFKDDPELLASAFNYLQEFQTA